MILIPAMELMSGKVVSREGDGPSWPTVLIDDPVVEARRLQKSGAMFFHLVDLDRAFGTDVDGDLNDGVLRQFSAKRIPFQAGGGIRSAERVEELIKLGADGVFLGTLFYEEPRTAKALVEQFGSRIIATLDVLDGEVQVNLRSKSSGLDVPKAIELLRESGVRHVIHHSVSTVETRDDADPNLQTLKQLIACESFAVHAHCTIDNAKDLGKLLELEADGLAGIVVNTGVSALKIEKALQVI